MSTTSVVVHADAELLAHAVAARLAVRLADAQAARGTATVVLTGGRVATATYRALRDSPARGVVDWPNVDVWWGDERFLPAGHPERNETQAHDALLDGVRIDVRRLHPMPASDGPDGDDAESAAARYATSLAAAAGSQPLPHIDVLLLGVGEDGHVASIFPDHPANQEQRLVAAVRDSPKPPPVRITLTHPAINTADEVWLLAAGTGKASAVRKAITGSGTPPVPAAGVAGVASTRWLLDRDAAAELPRDVRGLG